jgi:hypothetical protein
MTTQYKMLSDGFIQRFRSFMSAENRNPAGAFDAMPKTQPRKETTMSAQYRYVPLKGTGGSLLRERSSNLAFDEVDRTTEFADAILQFLSGKISEQDLEQVKQYLQGEAGVKTDQQEESDKMRAGAEARRAGAQDSASARIGEAGFNSRFPSAKKIGRDDMMGRH